MDTVAFIDLNKLIMDLKRQSKSISNWKLVCYILAAYIGYKLAETKDLKTKLKTLTDELEGHKATKGE